MVLDPLAVDDEEKPVLAELGPEEEQPVWESEKLSQVPFRVMRGHTHAVSSCHFCFEDTKIISCSHDRTAKLWDVSKCIPIHVFGKEHTAPISECNLTADNKRMVTSSYDKTVKAWDMETGKVLWSVSLEGLVTSCNISSDGKYVVSSLDVDNAVCIIDSATAVTVACINDHHMSTVTRCCFDPDNQRVCSVSTDRTIKLWDMAAQSTTVTITQGHANVISDCCFSLNGRLLCTASWDKSLKLWDINTGEFRRREPDSLHKVHKGSVSSCAFSTDASVLVSGGYDKAIVLWDVDAACKKLILKGWCDECYSIKKGNISLDCTVSPRDVAISRSRLKRGLIMWTPSTHYPGAKGHANVISDCCFSLNGRLLCTASWDKSLKLWDINTGEFRRREPDSLHKVHKGSVSSCAFSTDASVLVSGGYDKAIVLWDVDAACKKLILKGHEDWVLDVALSSNKKWLISSSKDSTLRLWNIENCEQIPAVIENKKIIGSRMIQSAQIPVSPVQYLTTLALEQPSFLQHFILRDMDRAVYPTLCEECEKPFPLMVLDDPNLITRCVFCRLASPSRNVFPLPPAP